MACNRFLVAMAAAASVVAVERSVALFPPPTGSIDPFYGRVHGFISTADLRVIVMVSNDRNTWWQKDHAPDAKGLRVAEDGRFDLTSTWVGDATGDAQVKYFGAWVVAFDFFSEAFACEGAPVPFRLQASAMAEVVVDRDDRSVTDVGPDPKIEPPTGCAECGTDNMGPADGSGSGSGSGSGTGSGTGSGSGSGSAEDTGAAAGSGSGSGAGSAGSGSSPAPSSGASAASATPKAHANAALSSGHMSASVAQLFMALVVAVAVGTAIGSHFAPA